MKGIFDDFKEFDELFMYFCKHGMNKRSSNYPLAPEQKGRAGKLIAISRSLVALALSAR